MSILIDTTKLAQLPTLSRGNHDNPEQGMCVMEAAAYIAGEPFSDHPACVSRVIAAFCRYWNDTNGERGAAIRARLKTYLPRLVGTRGTAAQEQHRSLLALDWLIRVYTPACLRLMPVLSEHADRLASLPPLTTPGTDYAAVGVVVHAARGAAEDAARAAAYAAAGAAAYAAARAAVEDDAYAAARAAAYAAARAAAYAAARGAAGAALQPTVERLQASAWELLDALIACGDETRQE